MRAGPLVAIGLLSSALLIGGCARKTPTDTNPSANTQVTQSPSAAATASPDAVPSSSPNQTSGPQAPTYPSSAKAYSQALLTAWGTKNTSRIQQLSTPAAVQQISDSGYPNNQWQTFVNCNASGSTHTVCIFRNQHGDQVEVKVINSQLGKPNAATEALLHKTSYPSAAGDYASAFFNAWVEGNVDRMKRLSGSSVTSYFQGKPKPNGMSPYLTDKGSYYEVKMEGLPVGDPSYTIKISKANLGKANAITGYIA